MGSNCTTCDCEFPQEIENKKSKIERLESYSEIKEQDD